MIESHDLPYLIQCITSVSAFLLYLISLYWSCKHGSWWKDGIKYRLGALWVMMNVILLPWVVIIVAYKWLLFIIGWWVR